MTMRGVMTPAYHPHVIINAKERVLAPGARIWNQQNLIEMPAALRGNGIPINYTEDFNGEIDRIWILTEDETRQKLPDPMSRIRND